MIVNLTPHDVHIHLPDGTVRTYRSEGVARVESFSDLIGYQDGIPIVKTVYGGVTGLPDPTTGTLYIVSLLTKQACPHRNDLVSPENLVRDVNGKVVGCKGLML